MMVMAPRRVKRAPGQRGIARRALFHLTRSAIPTGSTPIPMPVPPRLLAGRSQICVETALAVAPHAQLLLRGGRRVQVDVEGENVGGEDEGNDPLEHGAWVVVARESAGDKGDGQQDLDDDENQLDVEGDAQDAVFAVALGQS